MKHNGTANSLKTKLAALVAARKEIVAWHSAYEDSIAELHRSGLLQDAVKEGEPFPNFVLPNAEGTLVSLSNSLRAGPVIISFFRGEWCPFCRLMLSALTETLSEINAAGASLFALTPEIGRFPLTMTQNNQVGFEVLSDVDCGVGLAAGIIFQMPKLYRTRLEENGISLPERNGNSSWFLPVPATFIVAQNGLIAWRFADVDFTRRAEPADIIEALRNLAR